MRALLLDTHVWLWLVTDNRPKLPAHIWSQLEDRGSRNGLAVSDVSFWEIAVKASKNRILLKPNSRDWLKKASRTPGIGVIQLDRDVLIRSTELDLPVRDPADRMLIATALRYDLRLATADRNLLAYGQREPRLAVLDCST